MITCRRFPDAALLGCFGIVDSLIVNAVSESMLEKNIKISSRLIYRASNGDNALNALQYRWIKTLQIGCGKNLEAMSSSNKFVSNEEMPYPLQIALNNKKHKVISVSEKIEGHPILGGAVISRNDRLTFVAMYDIDHIAEHIYNYNVIKRFLIKEGCWAEFKQMSEATTQAYQLLLTSHAAYYPKFCFK